MTPSVRSIIRVLSVCSPSLAGRLAHWLFTRPFQPAKLTAAEKRLEKRAEEMLKSAEDFSFDFDGKRIAAYRFSGKAPNSKRILLIHGWMSGARYMLAIAKELHQMGHEVICFDLPAHGLSDGKRTNIVECAKATHELLQQTGPADWIIAHSFGGAVTAYMLERLMPIQLIPQGQVILLASPNQLSVVTRNFTQAFGFNAAAQKAYEKRLQKSIGATLDQMDGNIMYRGLDADMHILHCRDDDEVPFEQGLRFTELGSHVTMTELSGLGHRKILYHPAALKILKNILA